MNRKRDLVYYKYPNFTGIYIDKDLGKDPAKKKRKPGEKFPELPPYILPNDRYNTFLDLAKKYMKDHPFDRK